jgi:hypothetical protein
MWLHHIQLYSNPHDHHTHTRPYKSSQLHIVPPGYTCTHGALANAQFFNFDSFATESQQNKDFNPDLLIREETSTGYYTVCGVVMQLTWISRTRAAY